MQDFFFLLLPLLFRLHYCSLIYPTTFVSFMSLADCHGRLGEGQFFVSEFSMKKRIWFSNFGRSPVSGWVKLSSGKDLGLKSVVSGFVMLHLTMDIGFVSVGRHKMSLKQRNMFWKNKTWAELGGPGEPAPMTPTPIRSITTYGTMLLNLITNKGYFMCQTFKVKATVHGIINNKKMAILSGFGICL